VQELATVSDDEGAVIWRRIADAVKQLENNPPPGPVN